MHDGERLLRVLLVRGDLLTVEPLTLAERYHGTCASYELDEDADIPCRVVNLRR